MIPSIDVAEVSVLTEQYLSTYKIDKNLKNKLYLTDFEYNDSIQVTEELNYYGGVFSLPVNNDMLTYILFDRDIDITETDKCIAFLNTTRGKKIQRGRFRDEYLKPLNKWLRNRGITNKELALSLMKLKVDGDFEKVSSVLDKTKEYSAIGLARAMVQ